MQTRRSGTAQLFFRAHFDWFELGYKSTSAKLHGKLTEAEQEAIKLFESLWPVESIESLMPVDSRTRHPSFWNRNLAQHFFLEGVLCTSKKWNQETNPYMGEAPDNKLLDCYENTLEWAVGIAQRMEDFTIA